MRPEDGLLAKHQPMTREQRRIAQLESEVEQWRTWGIVEIAIRNQNVKSYVEHWEGRALKAEAALAQRAETNATVRLNVAQSLEDFAHYGGSADHGDRKNLLNKAASLLRETSSPTPDTKRLDHIAKTLHIDATGDRPIYALFIPGTEGVQSKSDLRGLIDESMANATERKDT